MQRKIVSDLTNLRRQIHSVTTTKKITNAIRLVSMSLYSNLERKKRPLSTYYQTLRELYAILLKAYKSPSPWALDPKDLLDSRPLFIFIAPTKGLCGSLTSSIIRHAQKTIITEPHQTPFFVCVGERSAECIEHLVSAKILQQYQEISSHNVKDIAIAITQLVIASTSLFSSVNVVSAELRSFFIQRPHTTTIIPFAPVTHNENERFIHEQEIIWEQPAETITKEIGKQFLCAGLINVFFEALLAEHAARFLAMDSSTTNATKLLERLTSEFNKVRQTLITKEVAELCSGLE